ncbi:hypothetical protein UPYG_G00160080 [Umbra pygmaea]|uniref:Uncharacterized protein n=1 Tax=Umbra pygmaea TaxID=75934 RepID=A0ABD0XH36_UMBPY
MDISLTVSLMRGQMGTVIERAVSAAVETVLGEMLKVVSIKFDELKREVAAKEKETESIRQMLEISRSQMKTMQKYITALGARQAHATASYHNNQVTAFGHSDHRRAQGSAAAQSESLQSQRRTVTAPNNTMPTTNGNVPLKNRVTITLPSDNLTISSQPSEDMARSSQPSDDMVTVRATSCLASPDDLTAMISEVLDDPPTTDASAVSVDAEPLEPFKEEQPAPDVPDGSQRREEEEDEEQCEADWTISTELTETSGDHGPQSVLSPSKTDGADSFEATGPGDALPDSYDEPQLLVKEEDAEVEIICIKQEPEEMESLLMNLAAEGLASQGDLLDAHRAEPSQSQRERILHRERTLSLRTMADHTPFTSANLCSYGLTQPVITMSGGHAPRPLMRPWPKDLSLYEEYKLRRADLRRRSQSRRREMEKTLPQPLLADLVKERREKTRLRVARWRAKRKLQACLLTQMTQHQQAGQSLVGQSLGGQSLGGQSLGGQSLGGQSLGGQSLGGQSLVGQSLGGQSLGGQSLGGQSLGGQSLGAGLGNHSQISHHGTQHKGTVGPGHTLQRNSSSNSLSPYNNSFLFTRTHCDSGAANMNYPPPQFSSTHMLGQPGGHHVVEQGMQPAETSSSQQGLSESELYQ